MPLEQYIYLFNVSREPYHQVPRVTLLTYQTSWPTLLTLGIEIDIRVGFSGSRYLDCFEHASAIQRESYQKMIPSGLRV